MLNTIEIPIVRTAHLETPLGWIEVSGNSQAIIKISFVDSQPECSDEPAFDLISECINQLKLYFDGSLQAFDFKCMQAGTGFQSRVWNELLKIPFGKTISYMTLAKSLGDPKVIRAAAAANGKNNLAIVVPCHRVIGTSGELVGYAGGVWRKKWLLAHENKFANGLQTLF
jgi:methylated-DNA-[protein]-cysteine S-methyltransferase